MERRRNTTLLYITGGLTAVSAGVAIFGFLNLTKHCQVEDFNRAATASDDCTITGKLNETDQVPVRFDKNGTLGNTPGLVLAIVGSIGTAGFGTWFLINVFGPDGSKIEHFITDRDAVLYTDRYNRSLLRKTVKDVEKSHSSLELRPSIGLGGLGVEGRF